MNTPISPSSTQAEASTSKITEPDNGWSVEQERLLAEWSDKAICYRWLHEQTEKKYKRLNMLFTIPVIILSTLSGTANFGLGSMVPSQYTTEANLVIGGLSVFTGILSTIANFLRYAQGQEAHHNAHIHWSKLHRSISTELALHRRHRKPALEFMKQCRIELDRLMEQGLMIPNEILLQFNIAFRDVNIKKPEICNAIATTQVFGLGTLFDTITNQVESEIERKVEEVNTHNSPEDNQRRLDEIRINMDTLSSQVNSPRPTTNVSKPFQFIPIPQSVNPRLSHPQFENISSSIHTDRLVPINNDSLNSATETNVSKETDLTELSRKELVSNLKRRFENDK